MTEPELPAGDFATWLVTVRAAIRGEGGSDVPCGGCTACCRSSQFVHIGPDETDALAHIPAALLFAAPGRPRGHVVLGYDSRGHCPMLVDDRCSIYDHRPQTCRAYDCRVFAATAIDNDEKPLIARQARRWRFSYATEADRAVHDRLRTTAAHPDERPGSPTERAVRAIDGPADVADET